MKKTIKVLAILAMTAFFALTGHVYAASLDTIDVDVDKSVVNPGEEVTVTINFGQELGAYTFNIEYDSALFEYVSVDNGTANDTGEKVIVVYYDSTGGSNPKTSMSITFKAVDGITTSNPTEFMITAEGLANADASETYDDITTAIIKDVTVAPDYVDYTISLEYSGDIIAGEEKDMTITYSSSMGKYYENARLIAEATTPDGATVQIIGTDENDIKYDIIQSGWGDSQGYAIGGADVSQVLNVVGTFSDAGKYTITLSLIDRENSDEVITTQTFTITVKETADESEEEEETDETDEEQTTEEDETTLPKTGNNNYVPAVIILIALFSLCVYINKNNS